MCGPVLALVLAAGALAGPQAARAEAAVELLRARMEQLQADRRLAVDGVEITAGALIFDFYARRGFAPAWHASGRLAGLRELRQLALDEGLPERDYPVAALERLVDSARAGGPLIDRVDADILATETLVRIGYQLAFGKVDPADLDADWNYDRNLVPGRDAVVTLQRVIDAPDMRAAVEALLDRDAFFESAVAALALHRALERGGGWGAVPEGPALRPGDAGPRVAALRARLAASGDLASAAALEPEQFDASLEAAVRRFQARHFLDVDGVVGKRTIDALAVPVGVRIDQLRLTLERARWVFREVRASRDFVLVNIAAFRLYLVRDEEVAWTTPVVVGTPYHRTPVFRGTMRYLVLNPTWTVPYGISTRELLPEIQRDPGYLASRNFDVLSRDGNLVDAAGIDWQSLSSRRFPYTLRQGSGPGNALGRVKFMFPNEHAVYLHDTPARALFDKSERSFSHGCVRVGDPLELAARLLDGSGAWSRERIDATVDSGELTTVNLAEPMPVYILYWTAHPSPDGTVRFARDIYGRDAAVLEALDGPVRIAFPQG